MSKNSLKQVTHPPSDTWINKNLYNLKQKKIKQVCIIFSFSIFKKSQN